MAAAVFYPQIYLGDPQLSVSLPLSSCLLNAVRAPTDLVARTVLEAGIWAATGRDVPDLTRNWRDFRPGLEHEALIQRALREKMVPMLDAWARGRGLDLGPAPARLSAVFRHISKAHYNALDALAEELRKAGRKLVLLKGGDLDLNVYPEDLPRSMADLDLMATPIDVEALEAVLVAAGFKQGLFDRQELRIRPVGRAEKMEAEAGEFELIEFARIAHLPELSDYRLDILRYLGESEPHRLVTLDRDVYSVIAFDVHLNLSGGFDLHDSWSNLRAIVLPGGGEVYGQSYSDLLWFLAARLYHEVLLHTRPAMRYFVDVIAVLARFADRVDWDRVVAMGCKYKLHPSLYFVLYHANEILGEVVPLRVIEKFDLRHSGADRSHDWGDFVPKMLGELAVHPLLDRGGR